MAGVQVYEAWSRPHDKFKYGELLACKLASAEKAKAMVEKMILAGGSA